MPSFSGLTVATITPLTSDNRIDKVSFTEHAGILLEKAGVKRSVLFGMNGEGDFIEEHHVHDGINALSSLEISLIGSAFRNTEKEILEIVREYGRTELSAVMIAPPLKQEQWNVSNLPNLCAEVYSITGKPLIVYLTGASTHTQYINTGLLDKIENLVAVKNTQGNLEFSKEYAERTGENGYPGYEYLQGNDRLVVQVYDLLKQNGYPKKFGGVSGAANVLPIAQLEQELYKKLEKGKGNAIQEFLNNHAFKVVADSPDRMEPRVWKQMIKKYVPDMSAHCLNPEIKPLSEEQGEYLRKYLETI